LDAKFAPHKFAILQLEIWWDWVVLHIQLNHPKKNLSCNQSFMGEENAKAWRSYTNKISHKTIVNESASGIMEESLVIRKEACPKRRDSLY